MATILRDKAAWDAFCADGRASLASWTPPEYPCAVVVAWATPAFFTLDDARTLLALEDATKKVTYEKVEEDDDVYDYESFRQAIEEGWLTDDDGHGVYAIGGKPPIGAKTNIVVNLSDFVTGKPDPSFTHVVWYNK